MIMNHDDMNPLTDICLLILYVVFEFFFIILVWVHVIWFGCI